MVHANNKSKSASGAPSSNDSSTSAGATGAAVDGEWDLVVDADQQQQSHAKLPQDPSSFIFVMRDPAAAAAGGASPDPAPSTPPLDGATTTGGSSGQRSKQRGVVEQPLIRRHSPSAAPATCPEEARARMSNSPQLPMAATPSELPPPMPTRGEWALKQRSPPPQPAAVPPPPPAAAAAPEASEVPPPAAPVDDKLRRDFGTASLEEQQQRHLVAQEADAEHRALVMARREERQRLGDSVGVPTPAGDAAIAQQRQREAEAEAREKAARRREEEELRTALALATERAALELERAKAGPRSCECLGASGGHHRATCPLRS